MAISVLASTLDLPDHAARVTSMNRLSVGIGPLLGSLPSTPWRPPLFQRSRWRRSLIGVLLLVGALTRSRQLARARDAALIDTSPRAGPPGDHGLASLAAESVECVADGHVISGIRIVVKTAVAVDRSCRAHRSARRRRNHDLARVTPTRYAEVRGTSNWDTVDQRRTPRRESLSELLRRKTSPQ